MAYSIGENLAENNSRWTGKKFCPVCGKELIGWFARKKVTCSKECANFSKTHSGENHPRWNGEKSCVVCGKELTGSVKRKNKTCSDKCASILGSEIRMGEKSARWKPELDIKCRECGKPTRRLYKAIFCSRKCSSEWKSKHLSRENSPLWKGGSAYEDYPSEFNSKFRAEIRKRDGYFCQLCHIKSFHLDVHHIDENKKNCLKENMVSLCRSCHRKVHWNPKLLIKR